jgi:hypothetical protein
MGTKEMGTRHQESLFLRICDSIRKTVPFIRVIVEIMNGIHANGAVTIYRIGTLLKNRSDSKDDVNESVYHSQGK